MNTNKILNAILSKISSDDIRFNTYGDYNRLYNYIKSFKVHKDIHCKFYFEGECEHGLRNECPMYKDNWKSCVDSEQKEQLTASTSSTHGGKK